MSFDRLNDEVEKGLNGRNDGIPMGFDRLNRYIGIRKKTYHLIGGNTGSGKTSLLDNAYVLNPFDWWLANKDSTPIKLKIIYRSMERSTIYKHAKWVSRKIFMDYGAIIPIGKLLGWKGFDKLSKDEHDMFLCQRDYIEAMKEVITIIEGPENPVGVAKDLKDFALSRGKEEHIDEYNKMYIPNEENEIVLVILDTFNLLKLTKTLNTKKAAIDKMSDEFRYARDFYGYTIAGVSQFNRSISNPIRIKAGDVEPQLEDFKESGQTGDDCDFALALFDPMRYNVDDPSGYNLEKLRDGYGAKYFRSLRLIKNSYGEDDVRLGLAFLGQVGLFKEMKKRNQMLDEDYEAITNKTYFLS